jgi:hypothetical protein
MPDVIVKNSEYIVCSSGKLRNGKILTSVYFKTENELLAGVEYCLIGGHFYTVDRDGNPKNRSCFRILIR